MSRELSEQGSCSVKVAVGTDGVVREAKVIKSTGYATLDEGCVAAATARRFIPATVGGKSVVSRAVLPINWIIKGQIRPYVKENDKLHVGPAYYPEVSRQLHQEGDCLVSIMVDVDGKPGEATILQSTGFPALDQACLSAAREAEYLPGFVDGVRSKLDAHVFLSWRLTLAGASAQQTEPATTENPQLLQELKQIEADAAEKQRQSIEILRQLPVDPDECVLPVLVDLMEQTRHQKLVRRYISVFDHDMDGRLQRLLRQRGLEARPDSALVRDTQGHDPYDPRDPYNSGDPHHTNFWHFAVGSIEKVGADEYVLGAGYHCGSLCFGRLSYTLKIAGPSCTIVSRELTDIS
jgi:TonB family protein